MMSSICGWTVISTEVVLLQLEVRRDDVQSGEVRALDDVGDRLATLVVPKCLEERRILVEFRLDPVQGGQGGLRIEVDRKDTVPGQGKILGKMGRRRGLARTALEVHHGDDLQSLARAAVRHVLLEVAAAVLVEELAQLQHLLGGIGPAPACGRGRNRPRGLQVPLRDVVLRHAEVVRALGQRERAQSLLSIGRILLEPQHVQIVGDQFPLPENLLSEIECLRGGRHVHIAGFQNNAFATAVALEALFIRPILDPRQTLFSYQNVNQILGYSAPPQSAAQVIAII